MTVNELAARLREMYDAPGVHKTTMILLFGIVYADDIKLADIKPIEIVRAAKMQESYQGEISKGMRLAQYVQLKHAYQNKF